MKKFLLGALTIIFLQFILIFLLILYKGEKSYYTYYGFLSKIPDNFTELYLKNSIEQSDVEEAIKLLTTKEYHFAVWITPIYIYFYLFAIVGYLTNMQLSAAKKMKYLIPGTIVSGLVNVILNITLIPLYGMIGAAISAAVTSLITQLFLFYFAMKVFPLQINKKRILTLYLLLTIFTLPAYLIYALSLNLFLKIIIKIILIYLFTYICINRNFISKEYILNTLANYRYFNRLAPLIKPFI